MNNCHAGIGKCLPNWDFSNTYIPNLIRSQKGRINQQNIQPDMLNDLSANKSDDRKPDYLRMFMEAFFEGDCKNGCFLNSTNTTYYLPSLSFFSYRTYSVDPEASYQIFGFRGYVCDKCLTPEMHYVAFF